MPIYCSLLSPLSFLGRPGFSFVSRDEVARPEKLAERGCVALLALGGCFPRSCVLRALKDFAALSWSARLEDLGPRGVFTKGRDWGSPASGVWRAGTAARASSSPLATPQCLQTPSLALSVLVRPRDLLSQCVVSLGILLAKHGCELGRKRMCT